MRISHNEKNDSDSVFRPNMWLYESSKADTQSSVSGAVIEKSTRVSKLRFEDKL